MQLSEYQIKAARTLKKDNDFKDQLIECALGLTGEMGELIDHIKKHIYHGHPLDLVYISKECGDCMWYLAALLTVTELDMNKSAIDNIDKLIKRYPEGFSEEMSRNRVEYEK